MTDADAMNTQDARAKRLRFDDLLADLFGLNVMAARSIGVLVWNPKRYFAAASTPDWEDRFTPSVRLWFSISALILFLRFLWAGEDSPLTAAAAMTIETFPIPDLTPERAQAMAVTVINWQLGLSPFSQIAMLALISVIHPFWGPKTPGVQRVRFGFATAIPSTVFVLLTLPLLDALNERGVIWGLALMLPVFAIDTLTGMRGAYQHNPVWARIGPAMFFALMFILASLIAAFFAQLLAYAIVLGPLLWGA